MADIRPLVAADLGCLSRAGTGRRPSGPHLRPISEHYLATVAALSQLLLDSGRKFCFLFTDLSNPTSNHIYQAIGYRPVCDVDEYRFSPLPDWKSTTV